MSFPRSIDRGPIEARAGSSSKLSRAKRRPTLLCDPDTIVHSDPDLLKELEADWTKD